ncbi:hypothetical protein EMCRGX_G029720 [Ephydatia muelleri]
MARALLIMVQACLVYAAGVYSCYPACVHGTCESSSCSCADGWTGRQCTQALETSNCSVVPHNCSGLVKCGASTPAACATSSRHINVGTLGSNFSISFEYSTSECNGVLVRGEDGTSPGYAVTVELQDGTMRFSSSCGVGEVVIRSIPVNVSEPNCLCSGQWQAVKVIKTQDISYLEVTHGQTATLIARMDPSDACVAGKNVTFSVGTMKEKSTQGTPQGTHRDIPCNGYIRNLQIANELGKWMLLGQMQVQLGGPGPGSSSTWKAEGTGGGGGIMAWLYAGLGGAGMLLCCCSVVNIILVCAQCYHRQNKQLHSTKKSQRKYPGSQLHLLPALEIKDTPFLDNTDNPTTITFTPVSRVPPHRIHPLEYHQQDCSDGIPTSQNNLETVRTPTVELHTQHDSRYGDHMQGTEERGTTYRLNTTAADGMFLRQCSSNDNSI